MPHVPKLGIGRLDNPTHYYSSALKTLWNPTKTRKENWHRCAEGTYEWVLDEVYPGREWRDRFVSPTIFAAGVLGLQSEMPWAVNGRRGGAVAPNDNCFTEANEIGGGMVLTVLAAGADNDYTAMHWGDNYPTMLRKSPHYHLTFSPQQVTEMGFLIGLVDDSRSAGTADFALPDNGVFIYLDTDVNAFAHCVIRSNGVSVTDISCIAPTAGEHRSLYIQIADDGENIKFICQGSILLDWVDVSGAAYAVLRAAQLQPYMSVINRAAPATPIREFHVHDFRLIMDRGF